MKTVTDKVIDASALAAIAFQEPGEESVRARLRDHQWHAPALLGYEMANVCVKKIRRNPARRDELLEQHAKSSAIPILEHDVDQRDVLDLAERFNLSAYDASYLWLARRLGAELVTLDEKLERAAKAL